MISTTNIKHNRLRHIANDYDQIQKWLSKNRRALKILEKDHRLLTADPPYKIHFAVDFHEIYQLVFPLGSEKEIKIKESPKDWVHNKVVSQFGRICLFYGIETIPVPVLLPPHRDELEDFIFWLDTEYKKATQQYRHKLSENKDAIRDLLRQEGIEIKITGNHIEIPDENYEKVIKFIEHQFFQLSILLMGGYTEGFSILKSLFSDKRIEMATGRWPEYWKFIESEIPDAWHEFITDHRKGKFPGYNYKEQDIKRDHSRDILALHLVKSLNKKFKEENKREIVLLVSDAEIFKSLLNPTPHDNIRDKTIGGAVETTTGEQIEICRTTDIFHAYFQVNKEREELKEQYREQPGANPTNRVNWVTLINVQSDLNEKMPIENLGNEISKMIAFCNKNGNESNCEDCQMEDICLEAETMIKAFQEDRESRESLSLAKNFDIYANIYKHYQQISWFDEGVKQILRLLQDDEKVLEKINEKLRKSLENTPLGIPTQIAEKGMDGIASYSSLIEEHGPGRLYESRLLLVGEPDAGKTTLLKKINDPTYPVPNYGEPNTLGIDINPQWQFEYTKDNKAITFKVNIWDFGGQHIQYMLHQYFLTSRSLYVLVSDDSYQPPHFDYWFDRIKVMGKKSPVLVVLNEKSHCTISNFDYGTYKKRYAHDYEMDKRDVDFSIMDGRLEVLKSKIEEMLLGLDHIGDVFPWQWVTIRKKLENIKDKIQINIDKYYEICIENGITQEQDMLDLCGYLNDLGVLMHYKDDRTLRNTIFINPLQVIDALYAAISLKSFEVRNGRVSKNSLFAQWKKKGYTYDDCCKLLNLMLIENFEICYPVAGGEGDNEEYIVPMLLPDTEPGYSPFEEINTLKFRFRFPISPEGLISRLIVRFHEDIERQAGQDLIWKKGFILNKNGIRAKVAEDRSEDGQQVIDVEISGEKGGRRDFLVVIRDELRRVHKKIPVEEMVPCNCPRCRTSKNPHYFKYSLLQAYIKAGERAIKCDKSIEDADIWRLTEEVKLREEFIESNHTHMKELEDIDKELTKAAENKQKLKDLEAKIKKISVQLETEEKKKTEWDKVAEQTANRSSWWLAVFHFVILVVWTVLISIFGWNTMEPWTYIALLVIGVIDTLYFAIFRRKLNSENIKRNREEKMKKKLYKLHGVNEETIDLLKSELQEAESQKQNIHFSNLALIERIAREKNLEKK